MIVDNESDTDNTLYIALLYRYRTHTHTFAQIFRLHWSFILKLLADF